MQFWDYFTHFQWAKAQPELRRELKAGESPLWGLLEATRSQRQLHEIEAGIAQPRPFPRGRVGWKPEAKRSTERK